MGCRNPQDKGLEKAATPGTAVRFDRDVIDHFKVDGPGWQTRMNKALKKAIQSGIA